MADRWSVRLGQFLFGDEGGVVAEREIQAVMALTIITVSGTFVISPIVSSLVGPFGVSEGAVGQVITAYTLPSVVVIPVFGVLADRYGRKPVLVFGLILFGIAGASIAFVDRFEAVLLLRFVQGIGGAAVALLTVTVIGDLYTGQRETTAQGVRGGSVQVVAILAPPVAGALVLGSWQYPFLLFGLAVPAAAWVWVAFPPITPTETTTLGQYVRDLLSALTRPFLALMLFSFLVRFSLTFSFLAFISVRIGRTAIIGGVAVSVFGVVSLVASTQAGRIVDRLTPVLAMVVGFLLAGAGMIAMGLVTTLVAVLASVALFSAGTGMTAPIQKSLVSQYTEKELRAGSISSSYVFQGLGQTAGPLGMGIAIQYVSIGTAFVAFGIAGAVLGAVSMGIAYRLDGLD